MKAHTFLGTRVLAFTLFAVDVAGRTAATQADDATAILAQFAPTAAQAYGENGRMKTAAPTARRLETGIVSRQGKVADPEFSVHGSEVVVRGQYKARGDTSKANCPFTVDAYLINSWRMRD